MLKKFFRQQKSRIKKKIENPSKEFLDELLKEGKISKVTHWRARKQGFIYVGYHTPHKKNERMSNSELLQCSYIFKKMANEYCQFQLKYNYFANRKNIVADMTQDYIVYLLERELSFKDGKRHIYKKIREFAQRNKNYKKYFYFGDVNKNRAKVFFKNFGEFKKGEMEVMA